MKLIALLWLPRPLYKAGRLAVVSFALWFAGADSRGAEPASVPGQEFTAEIQVSWMNNAWSLFFANKGKKPALDDWWFTQEKWDTAQKSRETVEKLMKRKDKRETAPVTFNLWLPEGVKCVKGMVVASGHGTGDNLIRALT